MKPDTRKVVLYQEPQQTNEAYCFTTPAGQSVWIPRSLIHHISRDPLLPGARSRRVVASIESWKLRELGL